MPGSGTRTFLDPERYEASLRCAQIEAVVTTHGAFEARLTWAELHHLRVLRCEETFARIAYLSLSSHLTFIAFPIECAQPPIWAGRPAPVGSIVVAGRAARLHQSTPGHSTWGLIALDPARLECEASSLSGRPFVLPGADRMLRPAPRDAARLKRLHGQACRLAETRPRILTHPEVARAVEQGLLQALVSCLAAAGSADGGAGCGRAEIMIRFEEALAQHLGRPLGISELCRLVGVAERTLRACCARFLGVGPGRYLLMRRLKEARAALRAADPAAASVTDLARGCGFTELRRFARAYEMAYGEAPWATLRRAPGTSFTVPVTFFDFA